MAMDDVDQTLDLIQFVRRIRMHGAALTTLTHQIDRSYITIFSKKKNIESVTLEPPQFWTKIEAMSYQERIGIGALNRYRKIMAREQF